MRSIALVTAYSLLILSGVRTMQAMGNKDPNSSTLATAPVYDLTGTLGGNLLGSYHSSATDADGNTDSWWCDSTNSSVDCHEGTGLIHWVDLTDGRRVQYGCGRCLTVDLDHSDGAFGFAMVSAIDDPWSFLNENSQVIHLRIRAVTHIGAVENYVCMPILHLPVFQDGKKREVYAKHHSMEACQLFSGDFSTHLPTQASVLREATGQAMITNSVAGKSSPAAAAAMAEVGHIQTPEEMAGQVQAGQASKCAVITNPPGAEIYIDGNKAGVSPMVFVLLKKGDTPRVITIRMSGYKTMEKSVVPDGKTIPLGLILEKAAQ